MAHQVSVLPMDRDEVLGTHQVEDDLQLLGRGVARDVGLAVLFVHDLAAQGEEAVDRVVDQTRIYISICFY